ncbi:MAG TPA: hypothetical protein VNO81_04755 [Candidatus Nitrosotenuis sp.]|jgi:hypothetical protein|nr:hypothetical protein [Candidatus Nitrosotenuis sp.]
MSDVALTPEEQEAFRQSQEALVAGESLAGEGSAGARRKALRQRLEEMAGPYGSYDHHDLWLEAREKALVQLRRELGHQIVDLRGELERRKKGLRLKPSAQERQLKGEMVRKMLDLLEILGRLAEVRRIRQGLANLTHEADMAPPEGSGGKP